MSDIDSVRRKLLGPKLYESCSNGEASDFDLGARFALLKNRFSCLRGCQLPDMISACRLNTVGETCKTEVEDNAFTTCLRNLDMSQECGICMDETDEDIEPFCKEGHTFHEACIRQWVRSQQNRGSQASCPMCRGQLSPSLNPAERLDDSENVPQVNVNLRRDVLVEYSPEAVTARSLTFKNNNDPEGWINYALEVQDNGGVIPLPIFQQFVREEFYFGSEVYDRNSLRFLTDEFLDENDERLLRVCVELGRPDLLSSAILDLFVGRDEPDNDLLLYAITTPNLPNKDAIVSILLGTYVSTQSLPELLEVKESLDLGNIPNIMDADEHQKFKNLIDIYTFNV